MAGTDSKISIWTETTVEGQSYWHSAGIENRLPGADPGEGLELNVPSVQSPAGTRDNISTSGALDDLGSHTGEAFGRWSFATVDGAVSGTFTVEDDGFRYLAAEKTNGGGSPPYNLTFLYTLPADLDYGTELLTSYWIKHTIANPAATGQLKYIRWCRELHVYDKANECYMLHNTTSNTAQMYIRNSVDGLTDPQSVQYFDGDGMPTGLDKWVRVDVRFKMPTTNSSNDFECSVTTYDPDGIDPPSIRDVMAGTELEETPYKTSDDKWRYIIFQNYVGNDTFDSTEHAVGMQGIFISIGTLARVEIANHSTYSSATKAEILPEASWVGGVVTINAGPKHLTTGDRWVHVFNDAGTIVLTQEYV